MKGRGCLTTRKRLSIFLLAGMLVFAVVMPAMPLKTAAAEEVKKVMWHVDFADPNRFSAMLTSLYNMASTFESNLVDYDIRVIFVGAGIRFLTDDKLEGTPFAEERKLRKRRKELKQRLQSLQSSFGIKLELCDITRESIGLDKKVFYPGVKFVTSGVVRIVELHDKGFAYIKVQ